MQQPARLITVEEYERMIQAGVFPKDERLELIDGRITSRMPLSPVPAGVAGRLDRSFANGTASQVLVSVHDPIRLSRSVLQPDLALPRMSLTVSEIIGDDA